MGSYLIALGVLLGVRLLSALRNGVSDCDETYNYWEAAYLVSGGKHGYQTWEYAPQYALRSWSFVLPYGLISKSMGMIGTRLFGLCLPSALAEAALVRACAKRFDAFWTALVLVASSPGMFISSASLLPSSVALTLACIQQALWLCGKWRSAIWFAVLAVLWPGWPFVAVLFLPFAIETLLQQPVLNIFKHGILAGLVIFIPVYTIDAFFYGSFYVSPLFNIFKYNALAGDDELYGVEPATYYLKNLVLNLTPVVLLAALAAPACGYLLPTRQLAPAALWLATLLARPHKEERFTYPCYASIIVAAAASIRSLPQLLRCLALVSIVFFGLLRIAALDVYYWQPQLSVWRAAARHANAAGHDITICLGKEWYRYPSSYLLPENAKLAFVESAFNGQLPRPWASHSFSAAKNATVNQFFNDRNLPHPERFVSVTSCHFAIDFILDQNEPSPSLLAAINADNSSSSSINHQRWHQVASFPFLDGSKTPTLARAFLLPFYSQQRAVFAPYVLFSTLAPAASTSDDHRIDAT